MHRRIAKTAKLVGGLLVLLGLPNAVAAEEILAAVAANFTTPFKELASQFETASGHKVISTFSSTGKLYAEITQEGAPYDVFFSADMKHPGKLAEAGQAVADSLYVYALGRLVLWSKEPGRVDAEGKVLATGDFAHVALTDPEKGPYGVAVEQVMAKLGVADKLKGKLMKTDTIVQAYNFAMTGKVELAFIALSQLKESGAESGSAWVVPADLHDPIKQGAVVLRIAQDKAAVQAFMDFMRGPEAKAIIEKYGYGLE